MAPAVGLIEELDVLLTPVRGRVTKVGDVFASMSAHNKGAQMAVVAIVLGKYALIEPVGGTRRTWRGRAIGRIRVPLAHLPGPRWKRVPKSQVVPRKPAAHEIRYAHAQVLRCLKLIKAGPQGWLMLPAPPEPPPPKRRGKAPPPMSDYDKMMRALSKLPQAPDWYEL